MAEFPYSFSPVLPAEWQADPELQTAVRQVPGLESPGQERLGPSGYMVKAGRRETVRRIQHLKVTEEDVWVVTYPRSGTTWTQEMIWSILNGVDPDAAAKIDIDQKFHFLDMDWLGGDSDPDSGSNYITACEAALGKRRLIKTHLPLHLLPQDLLAKSKVVYVARNPMDVVVSYYHHHRLTRSADPGLKFPDFLRLFMAELLVQDPYLASVEEGFASSSSPNLLFLWYEDMKADLPAAIRRMAAFLDTALAEGEVARLADYLDIRNMKKNPAVNHADRHEKGRFLEGESFIRKGQAGGWRDYFTPAMEEGLRAWLQARGCTLPFRWG